MARSTLYSLMARSARFSVARASGARQALFDARREASAQREFMMMLPASYGARYFLRPERRARAALPTPAQRARPRCSADAAFCCRHSPFAADKSRADMRERRRRLAQRHACAELV